jgi:LAGLIDADG endonuclease
LRLQRGDPQEETLLFAGNSGESGSTGPFLSAPLTRVVVEMVGDNLSGADNQQERPSSSDWLDRIPGDLGHYIAGFVDGEGSFNVPIRRERDRSLPWRVSLCFNVSQIGPELPMLLRDVFGVGTVRGRGDGVFYFEVTRPDDLFERIFPFFERYGLRGPKSRDLEVFREIAALVQSGRHRTAEGIKATLAMRGPMNRGGKRRRCEEEILASLEDGNPQRPYAELPFEAMG